MKAIRCCECRYNEPHWCTLHQVPADRDKSTPYNCVVEVAEIRAKYEIKKAPPRERKRGSSNFDFV